MKDIITITGNIAADPERRTTGAGVPVTTFRVASSQGRFDRAKGEWVETGTNWYHVSAFRTLALHAYASLHRGERVIVTGRLRLRQWETATKKGLSVEIDADGIGHDLLWGTSQYSRAPRPADAPAAEAASSWPTARPGAGAPGTAGGAGTGRRRDWGAPPPEPDDAPAPAAGTGPERALGGGQEDARPLLEDAPF